VTSGTADPARADIIDRIRAAAADKLPLRIRAGGTKDFYGETLAGDIVDVRSLNGIVAYAPAELVITARAGTSLDEIEAALA
jgi:glycolate oxidase FAD binding subunit